MFDNFFDEYFVIRKNGNLHDYHDTLIIRDRYITHVEYTEKHQNDQPILASLNIHFTSGKWVSIDNQPIETIQELRDSILNKMERRNKAETILLEKFMDALLAIIGLHKNLTK